MYTTLQSLWHYLKIFDPLDEHLIWYKMYKTSWVSKIILTKLLIFKKFSCSWKPHIHSPSVEHPENKLSLFQIIKLKLIHVRTIIEASQKLIFHLNIPRIMRTADSRICVAFPQESWHVSFKVSRVFCWRPVRGRGSWISRIPIRGHGTWVSVAIWNMIFSLSLPRRLDQFWIHMLSAWMVLYTAHMFLYGFFSWIRWW